MQLNLFSIEIKTKTAATNPNNLHHLKATHATQIFLYILANFNMQQRVATTPTTTTTTTMASNK